MKLRLVHLEQPEAATESGGGGRGGGAVRVGFSRPPCPDSGSAPPVGGEDSLRNPPSAMKATSDCGDDRVDDA